VASGRVGVCPRCAVEGDRTQKPLHYCPFCGEYFCEKHAKPRLVMSFEAYQSYVTTYKDIAEVLRAHWQSTDGHPCPAFTRHFWQEYEQRKREELLPPLPVKRRPREEVPPRRWEREVGIEQAPTRVRVTARREGGWGGAKRVAKVLLAVAVIGLIVYAARPLFSVDERAAAWRVLELINEYRVSRGLHPLGWSDYLASRAKTWSDHLLSTEVLVHSTGPSDRMWGENIYMIEGRPGFIIIFPIVIPTPATTNTESLARAAVEGWKNSPGHNMNMLQPVWLYAGVGVSCSNYIFGYKCYVVAQFSDKP